MNILPQTIKDEISSGYKRRIFITSFWATFFILVVCSVIFLPDYIIARSKLDEIKGRKEINNKAASDQTNIVSAPRTINQKVNLILQSATMASVAERVIAMANAPTSGIVVNKISYQKPKIVISGRAPTRDSLISFKKEVDKIDFVMTSSIPVGDFAKDKDLTFTMTVNIKDESR